MVVAIWLVLALPLRNARQAALLVSLITLASFGYFVASDLAASFGHRLLVPLFYLALVLCMGVVWKLELGAVGRLTSVANVVLLAITALLAGLIVRDEIHVSRAASADAPAPLAVPAAGNRELPDIYVLVLEGYAREDVLRSYYGFENGLAGELRSLGFFVADGAAGNYAQMGQAFASSLNLEYLPDLLRESGPHVPLRRRLGELITRNRVFPALRTAGYHVTSYESEYAFLRPEPVNTRPGPFVRFTNFEYRMYEASIFPRLLAAAGSSRGKIPLEVHRHHVRWVLDRLGREPSPPDGRPKFVFAHLLMPHPPFAVQADGNARPTHVAAGFNDGDQWQELARGTGEEYRSGYLDAVSFLNSRVPGIVRRVQSESSRPTIFYILSSHGPASRLRWERPDPASVRERMASLLAVRFADGNHSPIHSRTTPVNAFRVLLNRAIGTELPMLPDRSYFSTWERLSEYTDVTDVVR